MIDLVHNSWFMFFRRVYLSYNIILGAILVLLAGFSYGMQLFYKFREVELDEKGMYSSIQAFCIQISLVSLLVVMSFVFATLLAKCVQFGRLVWRKEQFLFISKKVASFVSGFGLRSAPRWLDLIIQAILIIYLELLPLVVALIVAITSRGNLTLAVQAFLSSGSFASLFLVFIWWLGSIIENYKRLIMFAFCRRSFFDSMITGSHVDVFADQQEYGKEVKDEEDYEEEVGEGEEGEEGEEEEAEEEEGEEGGEEEQPEPSEWDKNLLTMSTNNLLPAEANLNTSKERNLWVLLFYYCCYTKLTLPNLKKLFQRRKRRKLDEDLETEEEVKTSSLQLRIRHVWQAIGIVFFFVIIVAIGVFRIWEMFAISASVFACVIINMLINNIFILPPHRPSKRRLIQAWDVSLMQRYIAIVEEAFYYSPNVAFNFCILVCYLLVFFGTVCTVFKITDSIFVFILPLIVCLIVAIFYLLRFNIRRLPWCEPNYAPDEADNADLASEAVSTTQSFAQQPLGYQNSAEAPGVTVMMSPKLGMKRVKSVYSEASFFGTMDAYDNPTSCPPYFHNKYESPLFRIVSVVSFSMLLVVFCVVMMTLMFSLIGPATGLVFLIMLVLVNFVLFKRYEKDTADSLIAFFLLFLMLIGGIFILGSINMQKTDFQTHAETGVFVNGTTVPYEICKSSWEGFSILDFAFFSYLTYEEDPYFSQDFETWFPTCSDCTVNTFANMSVSFFDLYIPQQNLSVIAVRGTDNLIDVVQDLDIWKESGLLQGASLVGPFVHFWPEELTASIIFLVSLIEKWAMKTDYNAARYYYQTLDEYVQRVKQTRKVILTGHSLGGGLAKIVGAKNNIVAVSFSAPGVVMSRKKLDISIDSIDRFTVSVKPATDLVAQVDVDGGIIQHIGCDTNFINCHKISNTIHELIRSCGSDAQGRWVT